MLVLRIASVVAVLAACSTCAPSAYADEEQPVPDPALTPSTPPTSSSRTWYGWQIGLADLGVVALWGVGGAVGGGAGAALGVAGALGYVGGGPTIHALHHQRGRIAGSVALRLGLPLVGYVTGAAVASSLGGSDQTSFGKALGEGIGALEGAVIGMIAASLTDSLALAWERRHSTASNPGVTPTLVPGPIIGSDASGRRLPMFGVSGLF